MPSEVVDIRTQWNDPGSRLCRNFSAQPHVVKMALGLAGRAGREEDELGIAGGTKAEEKRVGWLRRGRLSSALGSRSITN